MVDISKLSPDMQVTIRGEFECIAAFYEVCSLKDSIKVVNDSGIAADYFEVTFKDDEHNTHFLYFHGADVIVTDEKIGEYLKEVVKGIDSNKIVVDPQIAAEGSIEYNEYHNKDKEHVEKCRKAGNDENNK